eukprot:gene12134-biopygen12460
MQWGGETAARHAPPHDRNSETVALHFTRPLPVHPTEEDARHTAGVTAGGTAATRETAGQREAAAAAGNRQAGGVTTIGALWQL